MSNQPGKLTADKLQACVPYSCPQGNFFQLPHTLFFEYQIQNSGGAGYLDVPGLEQATPPKYCFLVYALCALVQNPFTYGRIQWPDGKFLSNVPVDLWSMMQTGRNGRLLERQKFCDRNSVIRIDLGTSQPDNVNVQFFFEGVLLIPA